MPIARPEHFTDSFRLLQQEGSLVHSCLCAGFTTLRSADPGRKGTYYSAFFQLSIGIERLMKLVFIIERMASSNLVPPPRSSLKELGHNLTSTWQNLRELRPEIPELEAGSIESELLTFLSDFARSTRYFNLDALSRGTSATDPLASYNTLFVRVLQEDVRPQRLQRTVDVAESLARLTDGFVGIVGHGLHGQLISQQEAFMLGPLHDIGSPHVIWHMYQLLHPIRHALEAASESAHRTNHRILGSQQAIPFMEEFVSFLSYEKSMVLRKKRWP